MSKEINLIESEIEIEVAVETSAPAKAASYSQPSLPGLDHLPESQTGLTREIRFHIKRVIEALLFASIEPIPFQKIRDITDPIYALQPKILRAILQELQEEYYAQQRAFQLDEIAPGYILRTCEKYGKYLEHLGRNKRTEKLSHASTEVLAIIAYRQPITRPQIEAIRGVDSSGIIANLLERQLIQPVGKLEAAGRPTLYGITKEFLKHYGLRDVKELPALDK